MPSKTERIYTWLWITYLVVIYAITSASIGTLLKRSLVSKIIMTLIFLNAFLIHF